MKSGMKRIPVMCRLGWVVVLLAFATALSSAQTSTTKPKNPSPELVSQLTKGLSVTRAQATGGAGALFGLAKSRLSAEEFGKVAAAVPGMEGLLKAAPAVDHSSGLAGLASSLPGGMVGLASTAEAFHKLGLSPGMAEKFVPVMTKFVETKGGEDTASLLAKALK